MHLVERLEPHAATTVGAIGHDEHSDVVRHAHVCDGTRTRSNASGESRAAAERGSWLGRPESRRMKEIPVASATRPHFSSSATIAAATSQGHRIPKRSGKRETKRPPRRGLLTGGIGGPENGMRRPSVEVLKLGRAATQSQQGVRTGPPCGPGSFMRAGASRRIQAPFALIATPLFMGFLASSSPLEQLVGPACPAPGLDNWSLMSHSVTTQRNARNIDSVPSEAQ